MARNCPNCKTPMARHDFRHVTVEACRTCELVWFDVDDLKLLLRGDPKAITELSSDLRECGKAPPACAEPLCPDCGLALERSKYMYDSPIVMHVCPRCEGFFTKKSDLTAMQLWLDRNHVESSVRHAGFHIVMR